jgi:signal transduction histidine kinase
MPDGGTITLGASLDSNRGMTLLTFADNGNGIQPEDVAKIFQPYFTTKDVGIGLGLAITERIVKEHGGEIRVASRPGAGTTFTVLLPQKQKEA